MERKNEVLLQTALDLFRAQITYVSSSAGDDGHLSVGKSFADCVKEAVDAYSVVCAV